MTTGIRFHSDSISVVIADECARPIATSLLFDHALSVGVANGRTSFVRPERLSSLPHRPIDSPEQPPLNVMRRMEFVYAEDRSDLVDFTIGLHESCDFPACLIVDSMEQYSGRCALGEASLMALFGDLIDSIVERRKTGAVDGQHLSPVVCAMIVEDSSRFDATVRLIGRYTSDVWCLRATEEKEEKGGGRFGLERGERRWELEIENDRLILRDS